MSGRNQIDQNTAGVAIGMNTNRTTVSSARLYMLGKNQGKAAVIWNSTNRKYSSGEEQEYYKTARKIETTSDVEVEEVLFVKNIENDKEPNMWGTYYVIVKNLENGYFDLIEMPRFHTQNMDLGFTYRFNNDNMRKIKKGNKISAGTVFATSARITESNEWCPGIQTRVAAMSHVYTEEDAVIMYESYSKKVGVTFKRTHEFQFNEDEWVPLNLYGTLDEPQFCPLSGQKVRSDGIVMGFRRKDPTVAMSALTKSALMRPDSTYDHLFHSSPECVVTDILVQTERYKNQSNNKRPEKQTFSHTKLLERLETEQNAFANSILTWYRSKQREYIDKKVPITKNLWNFICFQGAGDVTKDYNTPGANGRINKNKRKLGKIQLKDWRIVVSLKEDVTGKVRYKNTGMDGNKSTVILILPDDYAPVDDHGFRADMTVGNFPAFKRQIFNSLMELDVNFINMRLWPTIKKAFDDKDFKLAWDTAFKFYETVAPEYAAVIDTFTPEERMKHLEWITADENEFSVEGNPTGDIVGVKIIERLLDTYPDIQPTPVTYKNQFGNTVRTIHPIVISSLYYIMLDKFGDDISCQSTPKLNVYGLPSSLSKHERARDFYRATLNRNVGETEGRLYLNQKGGAAATRALALANSPELLEEAVRRIIRHDNPFTMERLVYPGEEKKNHSLQIIANMLADFGIVLRKERETDRTEKVC